MTEIKKTIIVTGGAGRIGSALAVDLVKHGHQVLLGDINNSKLLKMMLHVNATFKITMFLNLYQVLKLFKPIIFIPSILNLV